MTRRMWTTATLVAAALLGTLAGCGARKHYPDPLPGRHSADYSMIFGRLLRTPAAQPGGPPLWVIMYGTADSDKYGGRLDLTPPEKMTGYSGGELVEVTGSIRPELTHPEFAGTWYEVKSIRMWPGYVQP